MDIGNLLREAAIEVDKEDREAAEEALLVAHDEVVAEINLPTSTTQQLTDTASLSPRGTDGATHKAVIDIVNVIDDVNALLKDMNIQPKQSSTDDEPTLKPKRRQIMPKRKAKDDSYNDRHSHSSRHSQIESSFYSTEPSRVSLLLEDLQDEDDNRKPYYDSIKYSFMSPEQELMFRTMKVVKRSYPPSQHRPAVLRASSSAKGRRDSDYKDETGGVGNYSSTVHVLRTSSSLNGWRSKFASSSSINHDSVVRGASSMMLSLPLQVNTTFTATADANDRYDQLVDFHSSQGKKRSNDRRTKDYEDMRASVLSLSSRLKRRQYTRTEMKADPRLLHAKLDDAKECYFHPRVGGGGSKGKHRDESKDEEESKSSRFSFVMRQENKEKLRLMKLQDRAGKANYDCLVDKKVCPQCRMKQTYEEWKERRKKCPLCSMEYCSSVDWNKAEHRFFRSHHEYALKVAEKKASLVRSMEQDSKSVERFEVDAKTGRSVVYKDPHYLDRKLTRREAVEFYYRTNETAEKKIQKTKQLDEELFKTQHTFKPAVREYKKKRTEVEDDEYRFNDDEERDPVEEFEKRYSEDLEMRREKFPAKYVRSKVQRDELEPFRVF